MSNSIFPIGDGNSPSSFYSHRDFFNESGEMNEEELIQAFSSKLPSSLSCDLVRPIATKAAAPSPSPAGLHFPGSTALLQNSYTSTVSNPFVFFSPTASSALSNSNEAPASLPGPSFLSSFLSSSDRALAPISFLSELKIGTCALQLPPCNILLSLLPN